MSRTNFDNKTLHILDHGESEFIESMRFAFRMFNISNVSGWALVTETIHQEQIECLLLASYIHFGEKQNMMLLPVSIESCCNIAADWLKTAKYPKQSGFDGSEYAGFEIKYLDWYKKNGLSMTDVIMITPTWAMYGK